jgi:hypothetical protein
MLITADGDNVISRWGLYLNSLSWDEIQGITNKNKITAAVRCRQLLFDEALFKYSSLSSYFMY